MIEHTIHAPRDQAPLDAAPFNQYELGDGTVWTEFYRNRDGYLLRFPDFADFEVSADGTVVTSYPTPECDGDTLEHLFVNQLTPLALSRQGQPTFHASVVTIGDGAVAFLGQSGAGKSTLAATFALGGGAFLTDDALIIDEGDDDCVVQPSHASLRLWDDSVAAVIGDDIKRGSPISYTPKTRLLAGEKLNFRSKPTRLLAAYVLDAQDGGSITISPLTGMHRYMGWLNNSFLLDTEDQDLMKQHFEWTHRVSGKVPTFALVYPHDYGKLSDVSDALRNHAQELCRTN